jgi:hypothetical protein
MPSSVDHMTQTFSRYSGTVGVHLGHPSTQKITKMLFKPTTTPSCRRKFPPTNRMRTRANGGQMHGHRGLALALLVAAQHRQPEGAEDIALRCYAC